MDDGGGGEPGGRRLIACAAGCIAARYGITLDEATHVLHFEACFFGLPLERTAHLAIAASAAGGEPPEPSHDEAAAPAAERAARRWGVDTTVGSEREPRLRPRPL